MINTKEKSKIERQKEKKCLKPLKLPISCIDFINLILILLTIKYPFIHRFHCGGSR